MKKVFSIILFITIYINGFTQTVPFIDDKLQKVESFLRVACDNLNMNDDNAFGKVISKNDTIVYQYYSELDVKHIYVFSEGKCSIYIFRFSDMICGKDFFQAYLFKGKWRLNQNKQFINRKKSIKAEISKADNDPYFFELTFKKLDSKPKRKEFKKMKKIASNQIEM